MSWGRLHEFYSQADVPALVHIEPMILFLGLILTPFYRREGLGRGIDFF
jgi:hypothetical protein